MGRDLHDIKVEYGEFIDKVRLIVGGKSTASVENDLESLMDELRVRRDEVISYKH